MNVVEIKAAIRERDGHCCTKCGMTRAEHFAKYERNLEVHRLTPGSEYTMEGCVTVCIPCHGPLVKSHTHGWLAGRRVQGGFKITIPTDIYDELATAAKQNDRPVEREIIRRLQRSLEADAEHPRTAP